MLCREDGERAKVKEKTFLVKTMTPGKQKAARWGHQEGKLWGKTICLELGSCVGEMQKTVRRCEVSGKANDGQS